MATEIGPQGHWLADVSAVNNTTFVEVEIKTHGSDLTRDFENKKFKHKNYAEDLTLKRWQPNKMYYAVPKKLLERVEKEVPTANPKYGILVFDDEVWTGKPWGGLSVHRRAVNLHERHPEKETLEDFSRRMSSDLCHFYMGFDQHQRMMERLQDFSKAAASVHPVAMLSSEVPEP